MSKYNPKLKRKHRNQKPRQPERIPILDMLVGSGEIQIPSTEDFVVIPVTEYTGLVANNTLLLAVKRFIEADKYGKHDYLRTVLGMPSDDK